MANTYEDVRAEAQKQANQYGFDFGVEKLGDTWRSFMLPSKQNRRGHELRCEVVSCENIAKCRPGHGPTAR